MAQRCVPTVDSVISHEVTDLVSYTFDGLISRLPAYSWAQVFAVEDRPSLTSRVGYVLSVSSNPFLPSLRELEKPAWCWRMVNEGTGMAALDDWLDAEPEILGRSPPT